MVDTKVPFPGFAPKPVVHKQGPTDAQIEAARKQRAKAVPAKAVPAKPVITATVTAVVDPDPHPTAPVWNGKDADFPTWVRADMRYKEAYSAWMARKRR